MLWSESFATVSQLEQHLEQHFGSFHWFACFCPILVIPKTQVRSLVFPEMTNDFLGHFIRVGVRIWVILDAVPNGQEVTKIGLGPHHCSPHWFGFTFPFWVIQIAAMTSLVIYSMTNDFLGHFIRVRVTFWFILSWTWEHALCIFTGLPVSV